MSEVKMKKSSGSKRKAETPSAPEETEQTIENTDSQEEPKMAAAAKKKKTKKAVSADEVEAEQVLAVEPVKSGSTILSDQKFSELPIGDKTKGALKTMGFEFMTQIQAKSIPECLGGSDLVGAAKTGSGKTLAFVIPIVELLMKVEFTRKQGNPVIQVYHPAAVIENISNVELCLSACHNFGIISRTSLVRKNFSLHIKDLLCLQYSSQALVRSLYPQPVSCHYKFTEY